MATAVHQLVHTLTWGDAISGEVLALQRCLQAKGIESGIYAIHVDPRYRGQAHSYREFPAGFAGSVVLHYSLGSPLNDLYRGLATARRILIHHNLTPAKWFKGINPRIASEIEHGVRELPELCRLSDRLVADSSFNAGELEAFGFKAAVLELPIDREKWAVEANPGIVELLRSQPGPHVLHVGRIAPNKCIEDVIKAFAFFQRFHREDAKLWLAGGDIDTELYSFSLRRLVRDIGVSESVIFTGRMADSEIRALYENCHAYLCMSEHEGFCLPLIEAMHFGLPVIAFDSSALPDTLADGGILVREKKPLAIAALLERLHTDTAMRDALVQAGRERAAQLSFEGFAARASEIFGSGA